MRSASQSRTLVAAVGQNWVIGDGRSMPWHLPQDLAHFKRITLGGVMVMGRRTFDSIGQALPGRTSIVVTRDRNWSAPGVTAVHSLPEAFRAAGEGEVFVIGGGDIYAQTIGQADRIVLTEVHQDAHGSVHFPQIDTSQWVEVSRDEQEGLAFVELRRSAAH